MTRIVAAAWLLAALGSLALSGLYSVRSLRAMSAEQSTCDALPSYAAAARAMKDRRAVGFVTSRQEFDWMRRLFCAQYDVSPVVLIPVEPNAESLTEAVAQYEIVLADLGAGAKRVDDPAFAAAIDQVLRGPVRVQRFDELPAVIVLRHGK